MGSRSAVLMRTPARNATRGPAASLLTRARTPVLGGPTRTAAPRSAEAIPAASAGERNGAPRIALQRKLAIGAVDDPLEHEADRVAEQVMHMTDPALVSHASPLRLNRKCAECEEEEKGKLQKKSAGAADSQTAPPIVHEVLAAPGAPLDAPTRAFMERRFGYDLGRVRVHADAAAEQSAQAMNAHAYAVGHDIVFGAGRHTPGTREGQRLLAHELTHVVQQATDVVASPKQSHRHPTTGKAGVRAGLVQRQPKEQPAGEKPKPTAPAPTTDPSQRVYVVRDERLRLGGGDLVNDLADFKHKVMSTKTKGDWTLVLAIHGSEDRLGAQAPPDWQKNATFYQAGDIEKLFNNDKDFVKWRDEFGPTYLSLVACQVSKSFETTLIANLTRAGHRQEGRGLGAGCKPIATSYQLTDAPTTRAEFDKLSVDKRDSITKQLKELNETWGYYGAPPVQDVLHYYFDEEPKGYWVKVEVMVGTGHDVSELKRTHIAFWNRTFGPKAAEFRDLCNQGVGELNREHKPAVPEPKD